MKNYFAIAIYRSLVEGEPVTGRLDVQVRYYAARSEEEVRERLEDEERVEYRNHLGERVGWELSSIMAVEAVEEMESGDEVVGFIADLEELGELAGGG